MIVVGAYLRAREINLEQQFVRLLVPLGRIDEERARHVGAVALQRERERET